MNTNIKAAMPNRGLANVLPVHGAHLIPVLALGMALSLSIVTSYVLCV